MFCFQLWLQYELAPLESLNLKPKVQYSLNQFAQIQVDDLESKFDDLLHAEQRLKDATKDYTDCDDMKEELENLQSKIRNMKRKVLKVIGKIDHLVNGECSEEEDSIQTCIETYEKECGAASCFDQIVTNFVEKYLKKVTIAQNVNNCFASCYCKLMNACAMKHNKKFLNCNCKYKFIKIVCPLFVFLEERVSGSMINKHFWQLYQL